MVLIFVGLTSALRCSLRIEDIHLDLDQRQVLGLLTPRPRIYLRTLHRSTQMQTVNLRTMHLQLRPGERPPIDTH